MADHFAELALCDQQPGGNPPLDMVAVAPAFYVPADGLDNRERQGAAGDQEETLRVITLKDR